MPAILAWAATDTAEGAIAVRIDFDAPAGCSSDTAFFDAVRARTSRVQLAERAEPAVQIRVRLLVGPSKVQGELRVIAEAGETDKRKVVGTNCDEVVQALSLTAALAIDPGALLTSPKPAEPAAAPLPNPESRPSQPKPRVTARRARAYAIEVGAQALVAEIVSPYVNVGAAIHVRLSQRSEETFSPAFGISVMHLRNDVLQSPNDVSVRWTAVGASACALRLDAGAFVMRPCVLGLGGWLSAEGRSVSLPLAALRSWWSVGGLIRASAPVGAASLLDIEVGLSVPLLRRRFTIEDPELTVRSTPALSVLGGIGLGYGF